LLWLTPNALQLEGLVCAAVANLAPGTYQNQLNIVSASLGVRPARPWPILHHDGLSQGTRHRFCKRSCNRIGSATR